jgi:hypothetical protein
METVDKKFGQGSQISKGLILFWKDRYYVSIVAHPETDESKKALLTLASLIDTSIASEGPLPNILNLLPEHSLVQESIRYFHHPAWLNAHCFIADRNILHINDTTDALLAKYGEKNRRSLVLIVSYPDDRSAKQAYHDFIKSYLPNLSGKGPVQIEDGRWVACRLSGDLLMAVFNAARAVDATYLLDAVEKKQLLQEGDANGKENKKRVPER